jgi:hypothetical protein
VNIKWGEGRHRNPVKKSAPLRKNTGLYITVTEMHDTIGNFIILGLRKTKILVA